MALNSYSLKSFWTTYILTSLTLTSQTTSHTSLSIWPIILTTTSYSRSLLYIFTCHVYHHSSLPVPTLPSKQGQNNKNLTGLRSHTHTPTPGPKYLQGMQYPWAVRHKAPWKGEIPTKFKHYKCMQQYKYIQNWKLDDKKRKISLFDFILHLFC